MTNSPPPAPGAPDSAAHRQRTTPAVISAAELRSEIEAGADVVVLEIGRGTGGQPADTKRLPGAHYVDLPTQLAGERYAGSGANPLPSQEQIQAEVRRWGINRDSLVAVYTRAEPQVATRAWWTLRWAGVPDVRYLDGGLKAWVAAGGEVSLDAPAEGRGTFTATIGSLPTIDADQAAELARSGLLIDARAASFYTGENDGGHIPGALNVPSSRNLGPDGVLKDNEELRALYAAHGADGQRPIGVYCGGGVGATFDILALTKLGIAAALYPGSWSAWSSDPARPVATGYEPG